jgi:Tol biopolymer transport system component
VKLVAALAAALAPAVSAPAQEPVSLAARVGFAEVVGSGVISTGAFELSPAPHPDGRTFYFVKSAPGFLRDAHFTIVLSETTEGRWSRPEVASFSGRHSDLNPWISPDGRSLYFSSNRPLAGDRPGDFNIWLVEWEDGGWGEPRVLPPPVNSPANELWLSATDAGVVYFDSDRSGADGGWQIYRAAPEGAGYGPAVPQDALNSPGLDINPTIARDESYLLFSSWDRAAEGTRGDLYLSRREGESWGAPLPLEHVNTAADEFHPALSPDGRYLYFASDRGFRLGRGPERLGYAELEERLLSPGNGLGDIYRILVQHLDADLP